MGAPSVAISGVTRISNADSVTDGGNWDKWDSAQNPAVEPDVVYEGGNALSNKVGTSAGGIELANSTATHDFAGGGAGGEDRLWLAKVIVTNPAALNVKGSTGMILYIGSGTTTDRYLHYFHGSDTYPLAGGWVFALWDPNLTDSAIRSATEGSPDLNAIDYFAVTADFTATSKSENVAIDAIDYIDKGGGLLLTDGVGDVGTFQDFIDFDEGGSTNRYGICRTVEGILYILSFLIIGSSTETDFTDEDGGTCVFPDGPFGPASSGLKVDLANASSVISIAGWNFVGRGSTAGADSRPDFIAEGTSGAATFTSCVFKNFRNITATSGVTFDSCTFSDCEQVFQNGATFLNCKFSGGTHGDGAGYLEADDLSLITDCEFTFSDGHAIEWVGAATSTETLDGCVFTGYGLDDTTDAVLYNTNATGTLDISVVNGALITTRTAGGTVNVTANVAVTFDGMVDNTEVRIYTAGTSTELDGIENATAGSPGDRSFVASVAASTSVDYVLYAVPYESIRVEGFTWPSTAQTINVQQRVDRNYDNP